MKEKNIVPFFFILLLSCFILIPEIGRAQEKEWTGDLQSLPDNLYKSAHTFDRGVGFLDAGEMIVAGIENYGNIGYHAAYSYVRHGFWGEVRWVVPFLATPPQFWATNITTESGVVVDRSKNYNVIETYSMHWGEGGQGMSYSDWEAQDYSRSRLMGDDSWSDIPLLATSTRPSSWPEGYYDNDPNSPDFRQFSETPGERHWPGYWALDPDPESETFGQPVEDRFVSAKDIFYIMDDKYNGIRQGDEVNVGYPIGFDMEVSGYSYSALAYRDIVFFNYNLIYRDDITDPSRQFHTGTIDSLYFGFIIDADLPGKDTEGYSGTPWAEDDYCIGDTVRNIFLMFDKAGYFRDDDSPYSEGPVSVYGIAYLKTPKDVGLTGFHFFDQEALGAEPAGDHFERILYAMASGRPEIIGQPQVRQRYFHGDNPHFDDLDLQREFQEKDPVGNRVDIQWLMTAGPFSISPGDTLPLHFCIVGGTDNPGALDENGFATNPYETRFADILLNYSKALDLYNNSFQGTGPPRTPTLNAVGTKTLDENGLPLIYTEDAKVTLYWNDIAETVPDILTKEKDFEGYRIYKAFFDRDLEYVDWGQEIYEVTEFGDIGDVLTYEPVFQCDKINEYEGMDPFQSWFYVGNNSGVVHKWVDTDVVNGVRYRYSITAYDHWYDDLLFAANETARGNSSRDLNVIDVIPGVRPIGFKGAETDTVFTQIAGVGNGPLELEIIDDDAVLGHTYTVTFDDTTGVLRYSVLDEDDQKLKVENSTNIIDASSGDEPDASPIFDGVGLKIINHDQVEIFEERTGWTTVSGSDTSDYRVVITGSVTATSSDYEIRFLGEAADTNAIGPKTIPFQVWNVTEVPPKQVDMAIVPPTGDFANAEQIRMWEYLTEGSPVRTFTWMFSVEWDPDTVVVGTDTTVVTAYGEAGTAPAVGDIFTLTTKKSFSNDSFRFRTYAAGAEEFEADELANIKVVPNPYIVSSATELYTGNSQWDLHDVRFTHLPPKCTINIYTVAGDHIKKIEHDNPTFGEAHWDLLTKENLETSYGIYIYVIKTPEGKTKTGKLAIVK